MTREEAIMAVKEVTGMSLPWDDRHYEALQTAIKALEEPHWIPCSETVDIPDHEILACDLHGEMMFGYLEYKDEQWICASEQEVMYDPVAWREKPEPYKERREG